MKILMPIAIQDWTPVMRALYEFLLHSANPREALPQFTDLHKIEEDIVIEWDERLDDSQWEEEDDDDEEDLSFEEAMNKPFVPLKTLYHAYFSKVTEVIPLLQQSVFEEEQEYLMRRNMEHYEPEPNEPEMRYPE